ncbi:uncharacterized protein AB675_5294 [Cyphellophora attinorum]|uniref:Uncharacterized protein n=1 Tax=Cyphellophora attinorum TaxID=1664694 RepID=A0A0N0NNY0_9EURO|nr:uncharacterized protein AB675_5294 [Phialophora attinorum]KPI42078.1 hypothetical protein AB675_5294 [Phialophora attinorum]
MVWAAEAVKRVKKCIDQLLGLDGMATSEQNGRVQVTARASTSQADTIQSIDVDGTKPAELIEYLCDHLIGVWPVSPTDSTITCKASLVLNPDTLEVAEIVALGKIIAELNTSFDKYGNPSRRRSLSPDLRAKFEKFDGNRELSPDRLESLEHLGLRVPGYDNTPWQKGIIPAIFDRLDPLFALAELGIRRWFVGRGSVDEGGRMERRARTIGTWYNNALVDRATSDAMYCILDPLPDDLADHYAYVKEYSRFVKEDIRHHPAVGEYNSQGRHPSEFLNGLPRIAKTGCYNSIASLEVTFHRNVDEANTAILLIVISRHSKPNIERYFVGARVNKEFVAAGAGMELLAQQQGQTDKEAAKEKHIDWTMFTAYQSPHTIHFIPFTAAQSPLTSHHHPIAHLHALLDFTMFSSTTTSIIAAIIGCPQCDDDHDDIRRISIYPPASEMLRRRPDYLPGRSTMELLVAMLALAFALRVPTLSLGREQKSGQRDYFHSRNVKIDKQTTVLGFDSTVSKAVASVPVPLDTKINHTSRLQDNFGVALIVLLPQTQNLNVVEACTVFMRVEDTPQSTEA